MPYELQKNGFKVLSSLIRYNNEPFLGLWHEMKSGFYMTASNNQLSGWKKQLQKHFPKPNLHPKKGPGHWWSAVRLIHYSFEFGWNHYIWEVRSENRWDAPKSAAPATGSGKQGPILHEAWLQLLKRWFCDVRTGLWSFVSSAIFARPLAHWLPLLQASW